MPPPVGSSPAPPSSSSAALPLAVPSYHFEAGGLGQGTPVSADVLEVLAAPTGMVPLPQQERLPMAPPQAQAAVLWEAPMGMGPPQQQQLDSLPAFDTSFLLSSQEERAEAVARKQELPVHESLLHALWK
jgi:hypothetical protein